MSASPGAVLNQPPWAWTTSSTHRMVSTRPNALLVSPPALLLDPLEDIPPPPALVILPGGPSVPPSQLS